MRILEVKIPMENKRLPTATPATRDLVAKLAGLDGRTREAKALLAEIKRLQAEEIERRAQLQADIAAVDALTEQLMLGRPASAMDRIAARNIAALSIAVDRLERAGNVAEARETRRLLLQCSRAFGVKPAPTSAKPAPTDIKTLLAQRGLTAEATR